MIKFLATCALVEDKAAEIYKAMAATALAAHDEELGSLWQDMASDEEDHAQQVRFAARLSRENAFQKLPSADQDSAVTLLKQAEALLARVHSGRLSELEMLRVAVDLEKLFRQVHTTYTLLFQDTSMQKMFDKLARADDKHLAGLKERICRFAGGQAQEEDSGQA